MANQKFTSIKNDTIELASDDSSIMLQGFCFVTIEEITNFEQMRTIDAIGCILKVDQLAKVNIK
jgi:hypothetical protein